MSHTYVGGFIVHHRKYMVPDLLTKDEFERYMKAIYGVKCTIEEIPEGMHPDDVQFITEAAAVDLAIGNTENTENTENTSPPPGNYGG